MSGGGFAYASSRKKSSASKATAAARARLISQYSSTTNASGTELTASDALSAASLLAAEQNWDKALLSCGSNSFCQLTPEVTDLMRPLLMHTKLPTDSTSYTATSTAAAVVRPLLQDVSCAGNQTVVVLRYGDDSSSNTPHSDVHSAASRKADSISSSTARKGAAAAAATIEEATTATSTAAATTTRYEVYLWGAGKSASQLRVPVTLPSPKCRIVQLSCGYEHAGFISGTGQVYTWGTGEYGKLGHGTRSNVAQPRRVDGLQGVDCTAISCGAHHTAFIGCRAGEAEYIRIPPSSEMQRSRASITTTAAGATVSSRSSSAATDEDDDDIGNNSGVDSCGQLTREEYFVTGNLYVCGLGKTGQLGLGSIGNSSSALASSSGSSRTSSATAAATAGVGVGVGAGIIAKPTLVQYFPDMGLRVVQVSAGFHHTLVVTVPVYFRVFSSSVYACGYNEYGRLGLGHDEQMDIPAVVTFPEPFHPIQVSAGEQHSCALGRGGAYSWGSNAMGQLGIGNPQQIEYISSPCRIALPEGMELRKLRAGSRHTAGVTSCGQLLTWGWGEEGQLGHGSEKSGFLPRPVTKLPAVLGKQGQLHDVALGATHTFVMLRNPHYIAPVVNAAMPVPTLPLPPLLVQEPEPEPEPEPEAEETAAHVQEDEVEEEEENEEEEEEEGILPEMIVVPAVQKPGSLAGDDDTESFSAPITSVADLLHQREERRSAMERSENIDKAVRVVTMTVAEEVFRAAVDIAVSEMPPAPPTVVEEKEDTVVSEDEVVHNDDDMNDRAKGTQEIATADSQKAAPHPGYNVFYKEGQNLDNCLVANSAKRAELRKQRKSLSKKP